jgi:fumarate hydratase class I
MAEVHIKTPVSEKEMRSLKIGDKVYLSGIIFTARDRAHKFLIDEARPQDLPFNLEGAAIYHCGPVVAGEGDEARVIVAGPTTSARMNSYTPQLISRYGVRIIIGKGGMNEAVLGVMKEYGAIYASGIGGASIYLADFVKTIKGVYKLEEFGPPEAIWALAVEDFPAVVTMDAQGESLHAEIARLSGLSLSALLKKS